MRRFRVATPADVDLIISIAREAYGLDACDWNDATAWVRLTISNPAFYCLIGERTVGFLYVQRMLWEKTPDAFMFYVFGRKGLGWEALALVRTFLSYAKSKGCSRLRCGTETTSDVGVLLKRIGRGKVTQEVTYSIGL